MQVVSFMRVFSLGCSSEKVKFNGAHISNPVVHMGSFQMGLEKNKNSENSSISCLCYNSMYSLLYFNVLIQGPLFHGTHMLQWYRGIVFIFYFRELTLHPPPPSTKLLLFSFLPPLYPVSTSWTTALQTGLSHENSIFTFVHLLTSPKSGAEILRTKLLVVVNQMDYGEWKIANQLFTAPWEVVDAEIWK